MLFYNSIFTIHSITQQFHEHAGRMYNSLLRKFITANPNFELNLQNIPEVIEYSNNIINMKKKKKRTKRR